MEAATEKDSARTLRLRNNKRRHRERQRQYTADLEQRVKRLEQEGVQAAIEIQLSARKVAEENKRLRRLLRHVGVHEETINSWDSERPYLRSGVYGEAAVHSEVSGQAEDYGAGATARAALAEPDSCAVKTLPPNCDSPAGNENLGTVKDSSLSKNGELNNSATLSSDTTSDVRKKYANHQYRSSSPDGPNSSSIIPTPSAPCKRNCNSLARKEDSGTVKGFPLSKNRESSLLSDITPDDRKPYANHQHRISSVDVPKSSSTIPTPSAPCKLLSHLTVNPAADITQIPLAPDDKEGNIVVDDGIPCARAYQMLIHYATSEPKLDAVAGILEEGCVPNEGPGGGCRVRSKTIMKALDNICL